jgi:hypothetical protein
MSLAYRWQYSQNKSRWTRLGEFSPIGRLFSLASFLEITEGAQYWLLLFHVRINFDKNGLSYSVGDFFTNSSGLSETKVNISVK